MNRERITTIQEPYDAIVVGARVSAVVLYVDEKSQLGSSVSPSRTVRRGSSRGESPDRADPARR